jgi:glycerol-3-phosphate acyltransferase PlsX
MPEMRHNIALDVMGGDHAPDEIVLGAVKAAQAEDINLLLVGDRDEIERILPDNRLENISIVPSYGVITEDDHPLEGMKRKPEASIIVAAGLVREGLAHAYVSMGSTGATMAAGIMALGTLDGIDRPALGGPFLGLVPNTTIIDIGSNVDSKPSQLLSYGVLGSVFAKLFSGLESPRVGLLSVGSEKTKGNRQVRETYDMFKESGLNFIGNIEGIDIPMGNVDVVVCDGFVGNILMKYTEGLGIAFADYIKTRISPELAFEVGALLSELTNLTNYGAHLGGSPLLGLNGVGIVGHGRSHSDSVAAAVSLAKVALDRGLVPLMRDELANIRQQLKMD